MLQANILIAVNETDILNDIEIQFIFKMGSSVNIESYTNSQYFQSSYNFQQQKDIIICDENFASLLVNANSACFLQLTEKNVDPYQQGKTHFVYKFDSKKIFEYAYAQSNSLRELNAANIETKIISCYSPIGGCGTTTLALALALNLSKQQKKVLYLNPQGFQSFDYLIRDIQKMKNDSVLMTEASESSDDAIYEILAGAFIAIGDFTYLPPVPHPLHQLDVDLAIYKQFVSAAKEKKTFDYIIIDLDSTLDKTKDDIFALSYAILVPFLQDKKSEIIIPQFKRTLTSQSQDKCKFICNKVNDVNSEEYELFKQNLNNDVNLTFIDKTIPLLDIQNKTLSADELLELTRYLQLQTIVR